MFTVPIPGSGRPSCHRGFYRRQVAALSGVSGLIRICLLVAAAHLALAPPAVAQCADYDYALRWTWGQSFWHYSPGFWSEGTVGLIPAESYVLTLDQQAGLVALEATSPGQLTIRGYFSVTEGRSLAAKPGRAYISADPGLLVINTANPEAMSLVGTVSLGWSDELAVQGDYAYVILPSSEISVVRISELMPFGVVGHLPTNGRSIAIRGTRAYVVTDQGLQVANIANPASPVFLGVAYPSGDLWDVGVQDDNLYVADGSYGLRVFDLSNPDQPLLIGNAPTGGASCVVLGPGQALVGFGNGVSTCIDIGTPASPIVRGVHRGLQVRGGFISQGHAHLAARFFGVQSIELGNGEAPPPITVLQGIDDALDLHAEGTRLSLLTRDALRRFDISNPAAPAASGTLPLGWAQCFAVQGDLAFVSVNNRIEIIDLANAPAPTVLAVVEGIAAQQVLVSGSRVYALAGAFNPSAWIIDVSNPSAPSLLAEVYLGYQGSACAAIQGTDLYTAENFEGSGVLYRWDVSDPDDIQPGGFAIAPDPIVSLAITGNRLHASTWRSVCSWSLDDLTPIDEVGAHCFDGKLSRGSEGRLYVLNGAGGYSFFHTESGLEYAGTGATAGDGRGVAESSGYLYIADSNSLRVFPPPCAPGGIDDLHTGEGRTRLSCSPNPFTGETRLRFQLVEAGTTSLRIYDPAGRLLRTLLPTVTANAAESGAIVWDGRDDQGRRVPAGTYFVRLDTPAGVCARKIALVR